VLHRLRGRKDPGYRRRAAGAEGNYAAVPQPFNLADGRLRELTLTTNATQLSRYAEELAVLGVRRVNVSPDTLDPDKFTMITRAASPDRAALDVGRSSRANRRAGALRSRDRNRREGRFHHAHDSQFCEDCNRARVTV
jgi:molybdenum cofactor biosynthesis enzyme MoaA